MTKNIAALILSFFLYSSTFAQNTQLSLNTGYTNQSFYSMQNGEALNVSNDDWDIAFSTESFSSTIRTNDGKGVELYTYHLGDTSAWNDINNNSVNNLTNNMFNSDTSWSFGAFDKNQLGGFDYGWGVYNIQTHHLIGDSLFILKTVNGSWKKLWIKSKILGEYHIKYANLDNTNEIDITIPALNYSSKNFVYYSLDNDQLLDREPNSDDWDITFTKYTTLYPTSQGTFVPYSVTGVFNNEGIEVAQADNISSPLTYNDYTLHSFSDAINTIGFDWKVFQGSYTIVSDRCYFVRDKSNNIWRLAFTNFEGTSTGNIEFNSQLIQSTEAEDLSQITSLAIYPNPASNQQDITLVYELAANYSQAEISMSDISGKKVYASQIKSLGLSTHTINTSNLESGIYMLSINIDGGASKISRVAIY